MNLLRILILGVLLAIGVLQGGTLVAAGIFIGLLVFCSFAALYLQLSDSLKKLVIKYRGIADIILSISLLGMLGINTATGLISSTSAGLLITIGLYTEYVRMDKQGLFLKDIEDLYK